jgi:hypothetical protein
LGSFNIVVFFFTIKKIMADAGAAGAWFGGKSPVPKILGLIFGVCTAAADGPIDKATLLNFAKGMKEWSRVLIFDDAGQVLASTFTVDPTEIQGLLKAWDERDVTVGEGITLDSLHFEVHRYDLCWMSFKFLPVLQERE